MPVDWVAAEEAKLAGARHLNARELHCAARQEHHVPAKVLRLRLGRIIATNDNVPRYHSDLLRKKRLTKITKIELGTSPVISTPQEVPL
jgi:hypothetical protein